MMLVSNVYSRLNTEAIIGTGAQRLEVGLLVTRRGVMTYGATTIGIIAQIILLTIIIAEVCIVYKYIKIQLTLD